MTDLSIHLLGTFHVSHHGKTVNGFRSERDRALLAFLAVERDHPHRREELMGVLWPEMPEERARNNLRVNLHRLRKVLQRATGKANLLLAGRDVVQLNPSADIWLDTAVFESHVQEAERLAQTHSPTGLERLGQLAKAVALYRDEFLKGFTFKHSPAFDHWAITRRENLHLEALHALYELAEIHQRRGELQTALQSARRQLELEPWREKAHRQLMGILARSEERSAALAQFQICQRILAEELGVEPSMETVRLYDRIQAAREHRLLNFPSQPAPLIGRKEELALIAERLADPACRLLTLTGPGGIGKTRLALQAAENQTGAFLDGVAFIPLAGVSISQFLVSTITDALALPSQSQGDIKKQLLDYLRQKEILLVLDSFEHLLEGASLLGEILRYASDTKMLVTSRERLNLPWEWIFEMNGLRCPESVNDEKAEDYSAVQLFVHSARRVQRNFSLLDEKNNVIRTCRLLDGMPLGIELAAVRVREYSCGEIAENIQESFDFLATSMRDVSPRHRSLRAAFEHSWNLLSEDEKRVFRKLSVFPASFDKKAAEGVASASFDMLSSFVDKSLLRRKTTPHDTAPVRYDMHELIRQFAVEKLGGFLTVDDATEKEMVKERHSSYYANFLRERAKYMRGEQQHEALEEVRKEIENIRVAWRWAVEHDKVREIGDSLLVMLHFYEIQGWFWEAEKTFGMAVECLDKMVETTDKPNPDILHVLGWGLAFQGWYTMRISLYERADSLAKRGLAIARQTGDRSLEAHCLDGLGVISLLKGEYAAAREYLRECYNTCMAINEHWLAAGALGNLGQIAMMQGDYEAANELAEESLVIKKEIGDKWGIATRTYLLGEIAVRRGEYTRAEALLQESLTIYREIDQQWRMADALNSLAKIATQRGEHADAQEYYQKSLSLLRETGGRDRTALVLSLLGDTNIALGNQVAARRRFLEALDTAVDIQAKSVILRALSGMAVLFAQEQNREKAAELIANVIHHPAVEQSVKERAERLLDEQKAELPPELVASAMKRGTGRKLDELAAECLGDEDSGSARTGTDI